MEENLVAGLISGLVVTLLVLVFRNFWNSVIVQWFEERVYKDVRIEGKWFGYYPSSTDHRQDAIVLKRHGHTIQGKMICTNGGDEGDEYSVCGSFRNMLLPLVYESTDKAATDRGTITLRCIKNGEVLGGKIALYSTNRDSIVAGPIVWFRKKEALESAVKKAKDHEDELRRLAEERERIEKEEERIEESDVIEGESEEIPEKTANNQIQPTADASAD